MASIVSQTILDSLTDIEMPRLLPEPNADRNIKIEGYRIPIYHTGCLVVGSGAAGLRSAIELKRRDNKVAIISQSAWGGTSACSGSDKQTIHTANTSTRGDDYFEMAKAIGAGGAMDEDTAYVEAVGSARAMSTLQYLGLPLPQDELGGTLRYQTDHDEVGRATSCGPRTSRLMVQVLGREAIRLGIPFYNHTTAVNIVKTGEPGEQKVAGVLAVRPNKQTKENPLGLAYYQCNSLILAAGGPGELYRDSVFPHHCFGSLGLALDAGLELVNLTESQFGIGTSRDGFPWNLSGTYVQVIPHIYSIDQDAKEHHFLADYFRTTQELASNIFRKGYQWPFHAERLLDFGSSLLDLAIFRETRVGRKVYMDFNRNPIAVPGDEPFSLERLDDDVKSYLLSAGATQPKPIDRLRQMNPLSIELYARYKVDICKNPLEFAVNNQHMNGGIRVDTWGRTNVAGIYAVGEAAGTHGATRPGGAALNAGQVFGTRAAEHISASNQSKSVAVDRNYNSLRISVDTVRNILNKKSTINAKSIREQVQQRMSDHAGIICYPDEVANALNAARALNRQITNSGVAFSRASEVARALQWRHMALVSESVLTALNDYIENDGGSRGARAICDSQGELLPKSSKLDLSKFRFRRERERDKSEQIVVVYDDEVMRVIRHQNRSIDTSNGAFFERDWPKWLTGKVFDLG